jgi:transposase
MWVEQSGRAGISAMLVTTVPRQPMHPISLAQLLQLPLKAEAARLTDRGRERLRWVLHFLTTGQSVTATCERFGIPKSTFMRWLDRFDPDDLSTLDGRRNEPHAVRQPVVPPDAVELIREYRRSDPYLGKDRIAQRLREEHGLDWSASTVGRVIERECLYFGNTPLHTRRRLAREARREGIDLPDGTAAGSGED